MKFAEGSDCSDRCQVPELHDRRAPRAAAVKNAGAREGQLAQYASRHKIRPCRESLNPPYPPLLPPRSQSACTTSLRHFTLPGFFRVQDSTAGGAAPNQHYKISRALDGIRNNTRNQVDAPPLVNFAFSIELYIKLLRFLVDGELMQGHNLHDLFNELDKAAPKVGATAIRQHRYARGDRDKFIEYLNDTKSIFEDWRYAYENELLIAVPDNVHALADAFRAAMRELHPNQHSTFEDKSP